jgi:hypothetical protein
MLGKSPGSVNVIDPSVLDITEIDLVYPMLVLVSVTVPVIEYDNLAKYNVTNADPKGITVNIS